MLAEQAQFVGGDLQYRNTEPSSEGCVQLRGYWQGIIAEPLTGCSTVSIVAVAFTRIFHQAAKRLRISDRKYGTSNSTPEASAAKHPV